jgi:hypothetical protein
MKAPTQQKATKVVIIAILLLLLMLIGFDLLPIISGNDELVIEQQAWLQVARDEYLAKDVLILAYRPTTYHSQVISDLQVILPQMEQAQAGFLKGDASLGLPPASDDIKRALSRMDNDYLPLVAALKAILEHPDGPVDPTQVNIILLHDYPYSIAMAQLALLLQQQAEATTQHLLIIKIVIKTLLILVIAGHYLLVGRKILAKMVREEAKASSP